jgi:hypothetical protein
VPDAGAGGATLSDVIAVLTVVVAFAWALGALVIAVVEWWARWRWRR